MAKDYATAFYHSKAWRNTQRLFLMREYYTCASGGGAACIVHHVRHITPGNINDPDITLNFDNLMALCLPCHNAIHGSGGACADGVSFDNRGNVLYTPGIANNS